MLTELPFAGIKKCGRPVSQMIAVIETLSTIRMPAISDEGDWAIFIFIFSPC